MKIHVNENFNVPKLVAVIGKYVRMEGVISLIIQNLHNGFSYQVLVIISPDITNDVILGFPQLKSLKIIPDNFPFSQFSISNACTDWDEIKFSIFNEFPDVIRDKLPCIPMKGKPMTVTLSKDEFQKHVFCKRVTFYYTIICFCLRRHQFKR